MSDEESEWVAPPSVTEESSDSEFSYDSSSPSEGDQAALPQPRPSMFTRVASYDMYAAAKAALDDHNGFVYTFESRYETTTLLVRVFLCRSHQMCGHRLKIRAVNIGNSVIQFYLEEGGRHTLVARRASRRGIHISLREDVDSLLKMGWGATRLRTLLQHRYIDQPRMSTNIPTVRQIDNRRAYLVRSCNATWDITNHVTFNAWASDRMCTTREDFMSVTDEGDAEMDSRIILDSFVIGGDSEVDPTSFGIIVSSRRVFRNVLTFVRGQPGELSCATDGTYKLHFAGWVIVDCGSEHVAWSRGSFAHKFVPWAYMFVRSESKETYTRLFCVIRERARTFFDVDVDVAFGSLDHSDAIASAFKEVWPDITLLNCWPHLVRQTRQKKSLLVDPEMYESMIKPQVRLLRSARSHSQFVKMSGIVTDHWIENGEAEYARWFRLVYLVRRWERWHVNGSGLGGLVPSQQGIESHHAVIKKKVCSFNSAVYLRSSRRYSSTDIAIRWRKPVLQ